MILCLYTRLIVDQKPRTRSVGKKLTPTADGSALMVAYPMAALIALEMTLLWWRTKEHLTTNGKLETILTPVGACHMDHTIGAIKTKRNNNH